MTDRLEPPRSRTCMKCRSAAARYHGTWAEEGLCRPCVMDMPSEVRIKVLRDMYPEDRQRWHLDNRNEGPWDPARQRSRAVSEPGEQDLQALIDAAESGREVDFRNFARSVASPPPEPTGGEGGRRERRACRRMEVELPLSLRVAAPSPARGASPEGPFLARTRNLSSGGLKAAVHDPALRRLPKGASLELELRFPPPVGIFRCAGHLTNLIRARTDGDPCFLCVAFERMTLIQRDVLDRFVTTRRGPETSAGP